MAQLWRMVFKASLSVWVGQTREGATSGCIQRLGRLSGHVMKLDDSIGGCDLRETLHNERLVRDQHLDWPKFCAGDPRGCGRGRVQGCAAIRRTRIALYGGHSARKRQSDFCGAMPAASRLFSLSLSLSRTRVEHAAMKSCRYSTRRTTPGLKTLHTIDPGRWNLFKQ